MKSVRSRRESRIRRICWKITDVSIREFLFSVKGYCSGCLHFLWHTQTSTTHLKEFPQVSSHSLCCRPEPTCRPTAPAASEKDQICFLRPDPSSPAKSFTLTAGGCDPGFIALAELRQVWARLGDLPGLWVRASVNKTPVILQGSQCAIETTNQLKQKIYVDLSILSIIFVYLKI